VVVKVGVAGLGISGYHNHLKPLDAMNEFKIVALCDVSKTLLKQRMSEFGVPKGYADFSQMVRDPEVETVIIATHPASHANLAIAAANAGKSIVVEKPMAVTMDEVDGMIKAAEGNGVLLTVFQNRRWDSDYLTLKNTLDKGLIGKVYVIDFKFGQYFRYLGTEGSSNREWLYRKAPGGGLLLNDGVHHIDQVLQLMKGRKVETVFGIVRGYVWTTEVDDYFRVTLTFEDGVVSDIEGSRISRMSPERWYVIGERGCFIWRGSETEGSPTVMLGEEKSEKEIIPEIIRVVRPQNPRSTVFYEGIYKSITEGKELDVEPEGVRFTMSVLFAALKSSQTGESVRLS